MPGYEFIFMADCQLGAYAALSGKSADEVARFAEREMNVAMVPAVAGVEWDAARYRAAVAAANRRRPDFVVMGGDMIHDPASEEQVETVLRITRDLELSMYWVPGNHDVAPDWAVPTAHALDKYREAFGPDYYAFDRGDDRFIVLNTVVLDRPELVPTELEDQMDFLHREFGALSGTGRRAVVFGHHPFFLRAPDEADSYWNIALPRRQEVLTLLHGAGVRHVFAGHYHRNGMARDGDLDIVVSGPVGYPLGDDPSGFRVVRVAPAGIDHEYVAIET